MLYIPSAYDISPPTRGDVYKMDYSELDTSKSLSENLNESKSELNETYKDILLDMSDKMESKESIDKLYDRPLGLSHSKESDMKTLQNIDTQLKRLQLCVKNIPYKLCIFHKSYLCCIRRDDSTEIYQIENFKSDAIMKSCVTIDLESMYTKKDTLSENVKYIKESIYDVLNSTRNKHSTLISQDKNSFISYTDNVNDTVKTYIKQLSELEDMLCEMNSVYNNLQQEIIELHNPNNNDIGGVKGLQNDIEKTHRIAVLKSEIDKITIIINEIMKNVHTIRNKLENILFKTDTILYDNIVMLQQIRKNLNELFAII
jgi:hypothetical protein